MIYVSFTLWKGYYIVSYKCLQEVHSKYRFGQTLFPEKLEIIHFEKLWLIVVEIQIIDRFSIVIDDLNTTNHIHYVYKVFFFFFFILDPLTSSSPGFFLMMATSNEAGWITNGSLFLITNSSHTFDRLSHYKI